MYIVCLKYVGHFYFSNQIKSNLLGTPYQKITNMKLENKDKKNIKTWGKRCNQDPKAEACTNMGPMITSATVDRFSYFFHC